MIAFWACAGSISAHEARTATRARLIIGPAKKLRSRRGGHCAAAGRAEPGNDSVLEAHRRGSHHAGMCETVPPFTRRDVAEKGLSQTFPDRYASLVRGQDELTFGCGVGFLTTVFLPL